MERTLYSLLLLILLTGCYPESKFYYTPPVYYAKTISVPPVDSGTNILAGASIGGAIRCNVSATMNFGKYFYSAASFGFNAKGIGGNKTAEKISGDGFDYHNRYRAAEIELGFRNNISRSKHFWFTAAGYGKGNSHSMVYETNDVTYHYSGNFSKVFMQIGLMFSLKNQLPKNSSQLIPAIRYSYVDFSDHYSPEGSFHNQAQQLFDCSLQFYQQVNKTRIYVALGRHLNGIAWGYRNLDGRYHDWRIEPWYMSFGTDFCFFKRNK